MLEKGSRVPPFEVTDSDGNPVTQEVFAGKRTVLFFYPRAGTPG